MIPQAGSIFCNGQDDLSAVRLHAAPAPRPGRVPLHFLRRDRSGAVVHARPLAGTESLVAQADTAKTKNLAHFGFSTGARVTRVSSSSSVTVSSVGTLIHSWVQFGTRRYSTRMPTRAACCNGVNRSIRSIRQPVVDTMAFHRTRSFSRPLPLHGQSSINSKFLSGLSYCLRGVV